MRGERVRWKKVKNGDLAGIEEGRPVRIQIGDKALCFVRRSGKLHAVLDRCPHQGSSFTGGWCEGDYLICPKHRMGFHLQTGEGRNGADRAQVFSVEERADGIYVALPRTGPKLFGLRLW